MKGSTNPNIRAFFEAWNVDLDDAEAINRFLEKVNRTLIERGDWRRNPATPELLSDSYKIVWPGIPVPPKEDLLWDEPDAFGFEYKDVVVGVNRNAETFWRNVRPTEE